MGHSHLTAPTSQLPNADFLWLLPHSPHRPYNSNFQIQTFCGCCHTVLTDPTSQLSNADFLWLLPHSPHRLYNSNFQIQTFCGCCHTVLTDPTSQTSKCRLSVAAFHSSQTLHLKFPAADFLWLLNTPHRPYISNFQLQTFYGCSTLLTNSVSHHGEAAAKLILDEVQQGVVAADVICPSFQGNSQQT